jgi:hypothetical protein
VITLANIRAKLLPLQGTKLCNGRPQFLFRGQNARHDKIDSTFARLPDDPVLIGQAYGVFRYARQICQGLRGYSISHLDGVALLQHYGWPTPLIDFTGTLEVAVFFALFRAAPGSEAVIYALDQTQLPQDAVIVDHEFLTHGLSDGALRHRWLRQDGFAITTRDWQMADISRSFDVLSQSFQAAIRPHSFVVHPQDEPSIADVLDQTSDPIPDHIQNLLRSFCDHQFGSDLHPKLQGIIQRITFR